MLLQLYDHLGVYVMLLFGMSAAEFNPVCVECSTQMTKLK